MMHSLLKPLLRSCPHRSELNVYPCLDSKQKMKNKYHICQGRRICGELVRSASQVKRIEKEISGLSHIDCLTATRENWKATQSTKMNLQEFLRAIIQAISCMDIGSVGSNEESVDPKLLSGRLFEGKPMHAELSKGVDR